MALWSIFAVDINFLGKEHNQHSFDFAFALFHIFGLEEYGVFHTEDWDLIYGSYL